jgi:hypothetical protein
MSHMTRTYQLRSKLKTISEKDKTLVKRGQNLRKVYFFNQEFKRVQNVVEIELVSNRTRTSPFDSDYRPNITLSQVLD